jgi:hypothetical protein
MNFPTKQERLSEKAGKACQVQTVYLITETRLLRTKKFHDIGP